MSDFYSATNTESPQPMSKGPKYMRSSIQKPRKGFKMLQKPKADELILPKKK